MRRKNWISSSLMVILVASSLFILGPANAYVLNFTLGNGNIFVQGENVEYVVELQIEEEEFVDISSFKVEITGPSGSLECSFNPDGTLVQPCGDIKIQKLESAEYGYGYGYGYGFTNGKFRYKIIWDTDDYDLGDYEAKLFMNIGSDESQSESRIIRIAEGLLANSCSIRAREGDASYSGEELNTRNRLSLFVPTPDATSGHGSIIAQGRRGDRVSYSFSVDKARKVGNDKFVFNVSGLLRRGTNRTGIPESSEIVFNSKTFEVDIDGAKFDISEMDVNFAKC